MTSQTALNKHVKRLFRLPFAPAEHEDIAASAQEFRRQLSRCESDKHLEAVVDHLMDTCPKFPPPADLRAAVSEVVNPARAVAPDGCEECGNTGWRYVADRTMDFCSCTRGVWMRQCERSRKDEQRSKNERAGTRMQ